MEKLVFVFSHTSTFPPRLTSVCGRVEMDILVLLDLETKGKNFSHPMDLL